MNYSFIKTVEKVIIAFVMAFIPGVTVTASLPDTATQFQATWYLFVASLITALAKGYDNYRKNRDPDPPSSDARIELDYATLPASLLAIAPLHAVAGAGVTLSMIVGV